MGITVRKLQKHVNPDLQLVTGHRYTDPPTDESLILYDMVYEALNNAIRHADATHVRIRCNADAYAWTAVIADNGNGFDTIATPPGRGIRTLRRRANLLGAKLDIDSTPGTGTVVYISFPLK